MNILENNMNLLEEAKELAEKELAEMVKSKVASYDINNIPQQKTGRWIETNTNEYTCSKCSHCFTLVPEDNHISQFHYCPYCRTKMEVEK